MSVYLINCLMFDFKIFKNRKQFSCNNVLILINTEMPQDPFLLVKQHLHLVIVPTMTNYTNDNLALFFRMPYFHHFVADSMASMNNRYCAQGNNNSKCSCFFKSLYFWQFFFRCLECRPVYHEMCSTSWIFFWGLHPHFFSICLQNYR